MKKIITLIAACIVSACTTYGKPVTDAQLDAIKQGVTTKDDLLASFGQPLATARNSDGTQVMSWGYAHVGFAGSSYKNQALSVILDASGKVVSYTTTDMANPYQ
ncbi:MULTISPECIES: hypothetical protein [Pseudomonas chlororaphis group]|uniref:hypothetical protein n=1 Tax=Pseudomonas chlororaphis group TaxID=136842 RepID=UPI001C8E4180|nr:MULTISPECIES: hypothetical protein [Pseudomonas chlororaphis group]MCO7575353.1 hypothetical protein [Pseudomonas protegens]MCO7582544.1 hypothetical protein [Pseudomonas chlororaphis]MCO7599277.1 hypothetical protein [Pseudomonas chlororaphis]QZI72887.1 hypothetical protein K5F93_11685 [Pseudomonas protegens]QZI72923.1 hypothetical protein K5F93_12000 [Pseudomonas protegens]